MRQILVTGANGFIGRPLCRELHNFGYKIVKVSRNRDSDTTIVNSSSQLISQEATVTHEIGPDTVWDDILEQIDIVVHLAARVHIKSATDSNNLNAFRLINTEGTLRLANEAARAGVHRFIYLSSIKVNGEETRGTPFRETDPSAPQDAYAISKHEAETGLLKLAQQGLMEIVIIRPPLVYGPGVKANFLKLMDIIEYGVPLPLASIKNQRSLVSLNNLIDFIKLCIMHPHAANQTFLVSDGADVSISHLIRMLSRAMDRPARLLPFPIHAIRWFATLAGKEAVAQRLLGSLQVDSSKATRMLGWMPIEDLSTALQSTANWYLKHHKSQSK